MNKPTEIQNPGSFNILILSDLLYLTNAYADNAWIINDSPVLKLELYAIGPGSKMVVYKPYPKYEIARIIDG